MHFDFVDDVTSDNGVLRLRHRADVNVSAMVWTDRAGVGALALHRVRVLKHALKRLMDGRSDWQYWLLAGHRPTQPDNRITRYRRLWNSLETAGISLPQGGYLEESLHVGDGGIRFFGAVRFTIDQVEAVHSVMVRTQAAIVFADGSNATSNVPALLKTGWKLTDMSPPEEILGTIVQSLGLVVDVYGDFDDPTVAVAAFGDAHVLRSVLVE